jgi:hypothetical protein
MPDELKVLDQGIVRVLKTRSTVLQKGSGTNYLLNRKDGILSKFTSMDFLPHCQKKFNTKHFVGCGFESQNVQAGHNLNMIISRLRSFTIPETRD